MASSSDEAPGQGAERDATPSDTRSERPEPDPLALEPTEAELDAWAEQERQRREAWLRGPTAEERAEFARQERERRLAELEGEGARSSERTRARRRYPREAQLAAEGAMSLLLRWSRRTMNELVSAGREWEDEFTGPSRRRRIPIDDDTP